MVLKSVWVSVHSSIYFRTKSLIWILIDMWILRATVKLKTLNHVCHRIGVLNGLHIHGLLERPLLAVCVYQFLIGLKLQIPPLFAIEHDVLGNLQDTATLFMLLVENVRIGSRYQRYTSLLTKLEHLLIVGNLLWVDVMSYLKETPMLVLSHKLKECSLCAIVSLTKNAANTGSSNQNVV